MKLLVIFAWMLQSVVALKGYCTSNKGHIEVTMSPPARLEVELGDTVSLVCAAHGHGMSDPYVYWVKGLGPRHDIKGKNMGPVAIGKSILYIEKVVASDIDTYRCVVKDCCSYKQVDIDVDIVVPDETCADVYGVGTVLYGATWEFKNWTEAVSSCKSKGMEIAFPRNATENKRMLKDIKASFKTNPNARKYGQENWVWIGGHDEDIEGLWKIVTTGEDVTWKNFARGQPDNWLGNRNRGHPNGQDCIGMSRTSGRWDDSFIPLKRAYVCKCPVMEDQDSA